MSRQEMKAVKKFIKKNMNDQYYIDILLGVCEDFRSKNFPLDTPTSIAWTLGDVLEVGDFETNYDIMHELTGITIGRAIRMLVLTTAPDLLRDPSFLFPLVASTNEQQDRIAKKVVEMFLEMNPSPTLNIDKVNTLLEKRNQYVVDYLGHLG